jgi:hypothetical protein
VDDPLRRGVLRRRVGGVPDGEDHLSGSRGCPCARSTRSTARRSTPDDCRAATKSNTREQTSAPRPSHGDSARSSDRGLGTAAPSERWSRCRFDVLAHQVHDEDVGVVEAPEQDRESIEPAVAGIDVVEPRAEGIAPGAVDPEVLASPVSGIALGGRCPGGVGGPSGLGTLLRSFTRRPRRAPGSVGATCRGVARRRSIRSGVRQSSSTASRSAGDRSS